MPTLPACAKPISGRVFLTAERRLSSISCTKVSRVVPVAAKAFATDSVEGQRVRPSGVMRFDLLKVVEPGLPGEAGWGEPGNGGEAVEGRPDLGVGQHWKDP